MVFERHHSAWIAVSLITVAWFVGATGYTQNRLARLDALSSAIETDSVPSIDHLSRAAVRLTRLSQLLDDIAAAGPRPTPAVAAARAEILAVLEDLGRYQRLVPLPGERALGVVLRDDVERAVGLVRASLEAREKGAAVPAGATEDAIDDALDRAVRSVLAALDFDIRQSEAMARGVREVRVTSLRTIVGLDALGTLMALVAVIAASRASRRHDELAAAHSALLAARVSELDRFAGRVAHDVLSPLGTIASALGLLAKERNGAGRDYIERSQRALQRVQQLVDGLLAFARAGAQPDPSARCSLDAVVASVVADCFPRAAEEGLALVLESSGGLTAACSAGVATSIVQNLVHNAIKYMGRRPVRRITVRINGSGSFARLDVEDTGPGIPLDLQGTIFEPFVRGSHGDVGGSGLGLATVRRLVESHGGSIEVRSKPGEGTLFRVQLPLATAQHGDDSRSVSPGPMAT